MDVARGKLPAGAVKLGAEDASWLDGVDLVVTSPGVAARFASVASRTEPASSGDRRNRTREPFPRAPIVAVTGTNGKSTVVVLLGEILKARDAAPSSAAISARH